MTRVSFALIALTLMSGACGPPPLDAVAEDESQTNQASQELSSGGSFFCDTSGPGSCMNQNIRIVIPDGAGLAGAASVMFRQRGAGSQVGQTTSVTIPKASDQHWDFQNVSGHLYQVRVHGTSLCLSVPGIPASPAMKQAAAAAAKKG